MVGVGEGVADGDAEGAGLLFVPDFVGVALAGGFLGVAVGFGVVGSLGAGLGVDAGAGESEAVSSADGLEAGVSVGLASGPVDEGIGLPAESTRPKRNPS
jgi:hypothetical protein